MVLFNPKNVLESVKEFVKKYLIWSIFYTKNT